MTHWMTLMALSLLAAPDSSRFALRGVVLDPTRAAVAGAR